MPNEPKSSEAISTKPDETFQFQTTKPEVLIRHNISDEELESLGEMKRDYLWERKWAALGLGVGTLPQAFQAVSNAYFNNTVPITSDNLIVIIICFVSFSVFCFVSSTLKDKLGKAQTLIDEIRNRPKQ